MEYEKIKQLMDDMGNSKLTSIDIDFPDGTKIKVKKEQKEVIIQKNELQNLVEVPVAEDKALEAPKKEEEGNIVKSPMVGTFYLKPSPTSEPFVEIGKDVKKGDTLCIIEAMKLMNEIESEYAGKIDEILVEDGKPVEYGTPLFRIK